MKLQTSRLIELFRYDPLSGFLFRKTSTGGRLPGSKAGSIGTDGRVQIYVDGANYKAHRIIWQLVTGVEPEHEIDHIDGNPSNNSWSNLRHVTHQINLENRRGPTKANPHKVSGVTKNKNRFGAQIKADGRRIWLGTYDTPEEAHAVYVEAKRRMHAGCTI